MGEEKISGGAEELREDIVSHEDSGQENTLENSEAKIEKSDVEQAEKIKQAQSQISSTTQNDSNNVSAQADEIAVLDTAEEQIIKLVSIASQDGPKKALKVARALNSNYMLDKMHDRLIDEEELRNVLIEKGFIEKTDI